MLKDGESQYAASAWTPWERSVIVILRTMWFRMKCSYSSAKGFDVKQEMISLDSQYFSVLLN